MASELDNWTLDKWLKRIRMGKYKDEFVDNGYDTPELCANLSKEDLDAMGVTNKHHRGTLFTQARKLLELVDKDSYLATADRDEQDGDNTSGGVPAVAVNGNLHYAGSSGSSSSNKNSRVSQEEPPATASQSGLMDYSEPWSGTTGTTPSGNGPCPSKPVRRVVSGPRSDVTDGSGGGGIPYKKPPSPGVSNDLSSSSATPKKESTTGMTRLQFKLKIREELFRRNVVLSELPYCREDGSADEGLMLELASQLSEKFDVESLSMYDALQEVWSNANKCTYNPVASMPKAKVEVKRETPKVEVPLKSSGSLDTYDEPFDTTNAASPRPITPSHKVMASKQVSMGSTDNYDEPFDTTNPLVPPPPGAGAKNKSATMPLSSTPGDLSNYDEPFDTLSSVSSSSPEKTQQNQLKKENSKTLPSPKHQRKTPDSPSNASPRHSPARSSSSKSKFGLFKKKDKKDKKGKKLRAQSMREGDVQFLEDKNSGDSSQTGLRVTFGAKAGRENVGTSSEDVSNIHVSPSSEQLSFMQKGRPPPLPSPRQKLNGSSGESDESPQFSGKTKTYGGTTFRKFITPPVDQEKWRGKPFNDRVTKMRLSQGSEGGEESPHWQGSSNDLNNEFDEEGDATGSQRDVSRGKKSRTSKLFKKLFKRKEVGTGSLKHSAVGGSTMMVNRCARVSDELALERENCLTASISMPDIAISRDNSNFKSDSSHFLHDYSEIEDSLSSSEKGEENLDQYRDNRQEQNQITSGTEKPTKPPKPPRKSPRPSPRHSPCPSPSLGRSTVISPPLTIPSASHHKVVIRGASESSTPDQMTIHFSQSNSSPFEGSGGQFSENSFKLVKPSLPTTNDCEDDRPARSPLKPSSGLRDRSCTPSLTKTEVCDDEDAGSKRVGSVSSNVSNKSSGSVSKPPLKPKPAALVGKLTPKGRGQGQTVQVKSTARGPVIASPTSPLDKNREVLQSPIPQGAVSPQPRSDVPPPKPARTLPRRSRNSAELSDFSSSTSAVSPTTVDSAKEVFSPSGENNSFGGGVGSPRHYTYANPPPTSATPTTSPLSPLSPNTLPPSTLPPPKPARRARSLKDVSKDGGQQQGLPTATTISGEDGTNRSTASHRNSGGGSKFSYPNRDFSNATLPSKFKPVPSVPASKPSPVPRTRQT